MWTREGAIRPKLWPNKRRAKEHHDAFVAAHIAKKRREEAVEDVKEFGKKNVWVIVGIASVVTAYFVFRKSNNLPIILGPQVESKPPYSAGVQCPALGSIEGG